MVVKLIKSVGMVNRVMHAGEFLDGDLFLKTLIREGKAVLVDDKPTQKKTEEAKDSSVVQTVEATETEADVPVKVEEPANGNATAEVKVEDTAEPSEEQEKPKTTPKPARTRKSTKAKEE